MIYGQECKIKNTFVKDSFKAKTCMFIYCTYLCKSQDALNYFLAGYFSSFYLSCSKHRVSGDSVVIYGLKSLL